MPIGSWVMPGAGLGYESEAAHVAKHRAPAPPRMAYHFFKVGSIPAVRRQDDVTQGAPDM